MRLKDKVAIITGGSRGIGFATADKFLEEGALVIITASSQASADRAVSQLRERHPDSTVAGISPDLASLDSVRQAFRLSLIHILKQGIYEGYVTMMGVPLDYMKDIPLGAGKLPSANADMMEMVVGNMVARNFNNSKTGKGYWDTGCLLYTSRCV